MPNEKKTRAKSIEQELGEWLDAPWEQAAKGVSRESKAAAPPPRANPNLQLPEADAMLLGTLMRGLTLGLRQGAIAAEEEDEKRISSAHRTIRALDPSLRAAIAHGLRLEAENPDKSLGTLLRDDSQEAPLSAVRQAARSHDPAMLQNLASEIEAAIGSGMIEPSEPQLSTAHMTLRRIDPGLKTMLQRGWGEEAAEMADEAAEGSLSAAHRTLRRMDPALRAALCRGMEVAEAEACLEEANEGGLSAVRQTLRRMDPSLRAALSCGFDELDDGVAADEGDEGGLSASHRTLRRMDPALRAALSRGFEEVGVPGEAGAEGALSAARRDQQYLDPGLRAAMAAMGSGFSCMQDEDEGRPSAARRTARRMDPALRAALARGIEEAGAADEEEAEGGLGMLRGRRNTWEGGGGGGGRIPARSTHAAVTPGSGRPCACPCACPLGERSSLAAPQRSITWGVYPAGAVCPAALHHVAGQWAAAPPPPLRS
jgi:hypothetical protein